MTIRETDTVDLITEHAESGYVSLIMVEDDAWADGAQSLQNVQQKLNIYLTYALDGQLVDDYPDLAGKPIRVQLDTTTEPPPEILQAIRRMREACKQHGVVFIINVLKDN
jgi:ABC-type amino acid transport substrate-binding protein